jgi:hypothetical protein
MHVRRFTRVTVVCAAAATTLALGAAASASASTRPASDAAAAKAAAIAALRGITATSNHQVPGTRHSVRGLTKVDSDNWSGYANDNTKKNTYSKVSGDWTEPGITCPTKEFQVTVFWVGIDGFNNATVQQDGTLAECYKGSAFYFTWWELYPTNDIQTVGTTVKPGDKIAASVVRTGTSYALKVTDSTTSGNNVSEKATCAAKTCVDSSAEWIAEAPAGERGEIPLADFKTWTLSAASVTSGTKTGNIKTFPDDEITMVGGENYALATPGALNSAGTGFSDTWDNSY